MSARRNRLADGSIGCVAAWLTLTAPGYATELPSVTPILPIQGIVISKAATQNIACAVSVCTATAANAVLNAVELHNMLAKSDVTVTTGAVAQDIEVAAPFTWVSSHALTLSAQRSIEIDRNVTVAGAGGLTLLTNNDGGSDGTLVFGTSANVNFWNLSSLLTIDGAAYTLVGDLAMLASDIATHPRRNYALARSIDSTTHYTQAPIQAAFGGIFEGLGNTISDLSIFDLSGTNDALFTYLYPRGILRDIGLIGVSIKNSNSNGNGRTAGLVVQNAGTVLRSFVAGGSVGCDDRFFNCVSGGLISVNYGNVSNSWANVAVAVGEGSEAGGLIGNNHGPVSTSFAKGQVSGFQGTDEGGLIGYNIGHAPITDTFAIVSVNGPVSDSGGLIGSNSDTAKISDSYSSGIIEGGSIKGGLIGYDIQPGDLHETYWDTNASAVISLSQGAGNPANDSGVTGLSDKQMRSGLPAGFDSAVWTIKHSINGGLPYLIATPPG